MHFGGWDDRLPPPGKINYATQAASIRKSNCRTNIHLLLITHHSTNTKLANDIDFQPWIDWADSPSSIPLPSPKQKTYLPLKARPSPKKWKYPESQAPFFRGELFVLGGCIFIVWAGFLRSSLFPARLMAILYPKMTWPDLAVECKNGESSEYCMPRANENKSRPGHKRYKREVTSLFVALCRSVDQLGWRNKPSTKKSRQMGMNRNLNKPRLIKGLFFFYISAYISCEVEAAPCHSETHILEGWPPRFSGVFFGERDRAP